MDAPVNAETANDLSETSALLRSVNVEQVTNEFPRKHAYWRWSVVFFVIILLLCGALASYWNGLGKNTNNFPVDFVWGAATSSYQIEGAVREDGRGPSVWDDFVTQKPSPILDNSTGDIACDHYHRMEQDVEELMKDGLHLKAYRFSMSWSRIFPQGEGRQVDQAGIDFYNRLIDTLLGHGIVPYVTLFHWDTPQALEDRYGGWMNQTTAQIFAEDYARTAFSAFGDRVKHWITLNEPWTVAVNGYSSGIHAPGLHHGTYRVAHNLLLAHAKATKLYRREFQTSQGGIIGIANSGDFRYPARSGKKNDEEAAQRAMIFQFGWFVDPLFFGEYPQVMRERLGGRLPTITEEERQLFLEASTDFLGLNYYSSMLASTPEKEADFDGYWADIHVDFHDDPAWRHNNMGWNVVPDGLREMLEWVSARYDEPVIYVTENGSAEYEPDIESAINDENRRSYIQGHLRACAQAIRSGVSLKGYFAWSLMDNFEWQFGYQRRFGIYHVDFQTQKRTAKSSAKFYRDTIDANGDNIDVDNKEDDYGVPRFLSMSPRHTLPEKVLIGYASQDFDAVRKAVHSGTNVVVWAFAEFLHDDSSSKDGIVSLSDHRRAKTRQFARLETNLDLDGIQRLIDNLNFEGYDHVIHMVSFGGWNSAHLDPKLGCFEWYSAFRETLGQVFHGIDWDLEGKDELSSPDNLFTTACLRKMGEISQLAHNDGYIVSMAPPQSYFDINGSSSFSRQVNLTDPERDWHSDFSYFGKNVYAYLMKRYGKWIDLVSIQFYESYSRAGESIYAAHTRPSEYFYNYVHEIASRENQFFVDFDQDPDIAIPSGNVSIPLSKIVLGFANGWADNANDKVLYVAPEEIAIAWRRLKPRNELPRGFMFWIIDRDGGSSNGVNFAEDLGSLLKEP